MIEQNKLFNFNHFYLQGDIQRPETWELCDHDCSLGFFSAISAFKTEKDARLWIIKELRRRVKEINVVKHRWMHRGSESNTTS
jgi:hypothetical protein